MSLQHQSKVYRKQGSEELVVASGGKITAESGGKIVRNLDLTNVTTAGAATYAAAALAGGLITRDPAGANRTDVTADAVDIIAAMKLDSDGECGVCHLINTADLAETITLSGGAGVSIANVGQTIAQNEAALLLFRRTSATAVTLYILGA